MQTHRLIGATLVGLLLSLSAVGQEPFGSEAAEDGADAADNASADQAVHAPAPVPPAGPAYGPGPGYAPGQYFAPAHHGGQYGGHQGGHHGHARHHGHGGHYGHGGHCGGESCGHDYHGCQDCGCCDCCAPCFRRTITGRLSGVYLKREEPDSVPLIVDTAGATLFDAEQFDFEEEPGVDGTVIYQLNPCWGVEGRYLWMEEWEASEPVNIPVAPALINTAPPSVASDTASLFYTSELRTAELSLRRTVVPGANIMAGFRYVEFDESLRMDLALAGVPATAAFNTTNNLYGFQVGGDALIIRHCRRLRVDGFAKAGVYWNEAEANTAFTGPGAVLGPAFGSAEDERAAFLYEAGVFAGYNVTRHLAVRVGYQVMFLDNVATASSQVSSTGILAQPPGTPIPTLVSAGDGIFIHGYTAGFEARY